ncbi:hypothetical protein P43SY_000166 [Pythium insidiosum]|uniref:Uncharacterized protein n=1 Tax=Pythium insidiosum TaxID=114742 RepID=A0AAD5Q913_PYTIN|nr:hypothetical protein P43SY_000166 [Pythium insidiosum]
MATKPETEAVVEPVDVESSAELTWKDVVYSQPLALTIRRCDGEIWRVHFAGELISQVIWFYDTPVNETHLVVVGIRVRTNRGATLSVGSLVGVKRVGDGDCIHVLDKLELETISALELDRNLHLFVLQNEEQITTPVVRTFLL